MPETEFEKGRRFQQLEEGVLSISKQIRDETTTNSAVDGLTTILTKNASEYYRLCEECGIPISERVRVTRSLLKAYQEYERRRKS